LAERFDVLLLDLRGFGDTEKPGLPDPPSDLLDILVEDLRALMDTLGIGRFGLVSHDVGS
jgi:pimeloyl-ACP methyl ester carboxylesterase